MAKRSYEQYCPLACALDLLGERWTLLIVRDLLVGARRYTDLHRGLPGLATDLLTERLRALEAAGIVRRRELPPPAAATVYELTARGHELEPTLLALARFGFGLLPGPPPAGVPPDPDRFGLMMRALLDPEQAPAEPCTWAFESAGRSLVVTVSRDGVEVHRGEAPPAEATFSGDVPTLYALAAGLLDASAALADGRLRLAGDPAALGRLRAAFPAPASPASAGSR